MTLDKLPEQFDAFVERARAGLSQEITTAKNIIAAASAEGSASRPKLNLTRLMTSWRGERRWLR